jgi:hypothetical protein
LSSGRISRNWWGAACLPDRSGSFRCSHSACTEALRDAGLLIWPDLSSQFNISFDNDYKYSYEQAPLFQEERTLHDGNSLIGAMSVTLHNIAVPLNFVPGEDKNIVEVRTLGCVTFQT